MESIKQRIKKKIKYTFIEIPKYRNAVVNKKPWFILGNHKSGTTAISTLLSLASGRTLTSDFTRAIPYPCMQLELRYKLLLFSDFIEKYKFEFSNELIKEPFLTFFFEELYQHFPEAKYLFIVRDPYQNIKSILNRLKIPGSLQDIDLFHWEELNKTPSWRTKLQSEMIGFPSDNYIESMSYRWKVATQIYLMNEKKFILVKYEDFIQDKEEYIYELCKKMTLNVNNDISANINVQYQPKGQEHIEIEDFFGKLNLKKIERICGENMKKLEY